jgi:hypothetical protein
MQIGQVVQMTEKVLQGAVSSLETIWCLGSARNKILSLSTTEAEYIAAGSSCSQLVWMKQMLEVYDVQQNVLTLYCDNLSAINISKNPIAEQNTLTYDITSLEILLKTKL